MQTCYKVIASGPHGQETVEETADFWRAVRLAEHLQERANASGNPLDEQYQALGLTGRPIFPWPVKVTPQHGGRVITSREAV